MPDATAAASKPQDVLAGLARRLRDAKRRAAAVAPLIEERPELRIADAYAIQRQGRHLPLNAGDELVGRKGLEVLDSRYENLRFTHLGTVTLSAA